MDVVDLALAMDNTRRKVLAGHEWSLDRESTQARPERTPAGKVNDRGSALQPGCL